VTSASRRTSHRRILFAALVALLSGCASPSGGSPSTGSPPTATATSSVLATPSPAAVATLADCAAPVSARNLHVVHHFAVSPDDIAIDQGGRLWVTSRTANEVFSLDSGGAAATAQTVAGGVDGVAAAGSTVYVVQQDLNRVAVLAPSLPAVLQLPNRTANAGIDGITVDAANSRLLVPDSPTGQLFAVALSSPGSPQLLAGHLGRPVAAAVMGATIVVASEAAPGLWVVAADGTAHALGTFNDLDEVVADAGLLYVTDLAHHSVDAVDPGTGAERPIAIDLPTPQGLAVAANGTLEIVDATTNDVYSMPACGASG
jgi:sugar lactone lactonase YvrE